MDMVTELYGFDEEYSTKELEVCECLVEMAFLVQLEPMIEQNEGVD